MNVSNSCNIRDSEASPSWPVRVFGGQTDKLRRNDTGYWILDKEKTNPSKNPASRDQTPR